MKRCSWCEGNDLYIKYHDIEWGVPVYDDRKQFEFLILESAQAGLSWLTILKKRENYRNCYDNFDPIKVATYNQNKIDELMGNEGIIRNRRKIESSINNAIRYIEIQKEYGSFCKYLWGYVDGKPIINKWKKLEELPAFTKLSENISKDLKKRGFKFLGPTTIYAHLQAAGLVNDHVMGCFRYVEVMK
ncbi:MAG: DNA-3-methyladenine glycosylase I [Candidatus Dadabacteria bacterium]|nr:DNA-3-methyladenine glycosylase I [Candidatus Dadabacteria bacterium]NIQ16436.1 DNA-3-methyladenine glycosylase I [Candidatus Dadabacteria bacterium]